MAVTGAATAKFYRFIHNAIQIMHIYISNVTCCMTGSEVNNDTFS